MLTLIGRGEIAARVAAIGLSANAVQADIHLAACSIVSHTIEHGDYTAGELLLNALPRGTRVKALAFWFAHFTNKGLTFKVDETTKQYVGKLDKNVDRESFKLDDAMETTFADLTSEQEVKSVTVESMIRNLSRNATNTEMHKDGKTPKVTAEARALASEIVAFVRARKAA